MAYQSTLTAELDAGGDITALWRTDAGKAPKLVKDLATCMDDLESFVILGTSKPEIRGWLRHQLGSSAGS